MASNGKVFYSPQIKKIILFMAKYYKENECYPKLDEIGKALNVSKIVAHLLVIRGITTFEEAKLFFRPKISHLHDPFLLKDMQKAVDRIDLAIVKNEKVLGLSLIQI